MSSERPDLDGVRLRKIGAPDVWLVFHGRRHRIASPAVYESLFSDTDNILLNLDLDDIFVGPELNDGSCLIQFEGDGAVYLATGAGTEAKLYYVQSWETSVDFGFDLAKLRIAPTILREVTPKGEPLTSAPDRAARGA